MTHYAAAWAATIVREAFAPLRLAVGLDQPRCDSCGTLLRDGQTTRPCPVCTRAEQALTARVKVGGDVRFRGVAVVAAIASNA